MASDVHIRRCINATCRVDTYKAGWDAAFTSCPLCQMLGSPIFPPPFDMKKVPDGQQDHSS